MFGFDLKSLAVGIALGWFVIPHAYGFIASKMNG